MTAAADEPLPSPKAEHPTALRSRRPTLYLRIAGLALRRPRLVPHLVRAAWAFRARDWYRRPPWLPLPPPSYLKWRLETAYGDPDAEPTPEELERYLVWTSRMRAHMRGGPE